RLRQRQWGADQIETNVRWVAAYIQFHGLRHPRELGPEQVAAFLAHLRRDPETTPQREVAVRAALKFLHEEFLPTDTDPPAPEQARACAAPVAGLAPTASPFLNRCHEILRVRHYALRTEECYVQWIKKFILFHGKRHPQDLGAPEIEAFLTHLAVDEEVAASTQNQALNALLFLYQQVLEVE